MPTIKINLEKLSPVPDGVYDVIVKNVKLKESKSSFNQYLTWQLEVTRGQFKGRVIFMNTSLSTNALWRIKNIFDVIRFDYDDILEFEPKDLKNYKFQVKTVSEEYNGKIYNEVIDFFPSM